VEDYATQVNSKNRQELWNPIAKLWLPTSKLRSCSLPPVAFDLKPELSPLSFFDGLLGSNKPTDLIAQTRRQTHGLRQIGSDNNFRVGDHSGVDRFGQHCRVHRDQSPSSRTCAAISRGPAHFYAKKHEECRCQRDNCNFLLEEPLSR
jgi:hypothetical protein